MNTISVEFPVADWVWLCEFLNQVIKEGELEPYDKADMERLVDLLECMTV